MTKEYTALLRNKHSSLFACATLKSSDSVPFYRGKSGTEHQMLRALIFLFSPLSLQGALLSPVDGIILLSLSQLMSKHFRCVCRSVMGTGLLANNHLSGGQAGVGEWANARPPLSPTPSRKDDATLWDIIWLFAILIYLLGQKTAFGIQTENTMIRISY